MVAMWLPKPDDRQMAKVTKRTVDALKPEAGQDVLLWDDELPGFGVRMRPSGSKSYFVKYRTASGRQRWLTLGRHGPLTPELARKRALQEKAAVSGGADPSGDRRKRRRESTLAEIADRYVAEHVASHNRPSTAGEVVRIVEKRIKPRLGSIKITDLKRSDVKGWHQAMSATPYEANRALAYLSKMLNLAVKDWELRPDNPCTGIKRFPERKRERFLSSEEFARLGEVLTSYSGWPYAVTAVRLLVFTGARLGEILGLRWEWIDFERGEARLPDSKTGAKTLHLPPPALAVLAELPRLDGNPYVIVGPKEGAVLGKLEKSWRAIRERVTLGMWRDSENEKIASLFAKLSRKLDRQPTIAEFREAAADRELSLPVGLTDVRIHDLRHAFASVAASSGMGLPIIGKILGHTQAATTGRYAHLASDPVKAAASAVAGKIAAAMARGSSKAGKESGKVMPLRFRTQ
jgi:integrase